MNSEIETARQISLAFLSILGINPYQKTRLHGFLVIASLLIVLVLVFLQFIFEEISFRLISSSFESTYTLIHVSGGMQILH